METRLNPKGTQIEVVPDPPLESDSIISTDFAHDRKRPTSGIITRWGHRVEAQFRQQGLHVGFKTTDGWEFTVDGKPRMIVDQGEIRLSIGVETDLELLALLEEAKEDHAASS